MYGFKPQHARGKPVQQAPQAQQSGANGSVTPFGSKGLNELRNLIPQMEAMGYPQAQPQDNRGAAGLKAIIPQMEAMGYKQQPQYFANGGRVRPRGFVAGKGTGTSDSIPARLSNGEYVLPADTVKAVGVEALDSLRAATHAPVKHEQAKAAHGFFAGGTPGGLDEEKLKNSFGDAAAVARDSSVAQVGGLANNGGADASRFAQVPAPIGTQPNRTPEPATPSAPQPAAQTAPAKVPLGQMHSIGARSGAQMVADGARSGAQSFFDSFQKAPEPAAVAPSSVTPSATTTAQDSIAGAGRGVVNPPLAKPSAPAPSAPQPEANTGNEIMPGVFKHGRGQYSDQSTGMGMPAGFTGQPSAANNAILQRMSDQSQAESMARVSAQQPAGFTPAGMQAPTVRHSGNDWQSRNDLRNAMVSATSIMNDGGKWDKHGKGVVSPERAYAMELAKTDATLRGAQPGVDVAAMRENAGIQREGMQQAGATTRTGMTEQGANSREAGRNALATDEFGLRREAAGFQTRAAKRRESAYDNYSKAKTDEDRQAIAKQFPDLFGQAKDAVHRMEVVRGKTDPMTGQSSGDYVVVQDPKTGEVRQVPIGAQQGAALPPGMKRQIGTSNGRPVYEDMNGKQVIAKG